MAVGQSARFDEQSDQTDINFGDNHPDSTVVRAEADQLYLANIIDEYFLTIPNSKPDKFFCRSK